MCMCMYIIFMYIKDISICRCSYLVRHIDYRISLLESYRSRSYSWTELDKWSVRLLRRNLLLPLLLLLLLLFVCVWVCLGVWLVGGCRVYIMFVSTVYLFYQSCSRLTSLFPCRTPFDLEHEPDWWMCRTVPFFPPDLLLLLLLLSILNCTTALFSCMSFIYLHLFYLKFPCSPIHIHHHFSSLSSFFSHFLSFVYFISQSSIEYYASIRNIGVQNVVVVDRYVLFIEEIPSWIQGVRYCIVNDNMLRALCAINAVLMVAMIQWHGQRREEKKGRYYTVYCLH